jgi:hypothetical protein
MKKIHFLGLLIILLTTITSCSKQLYSGNGAYSDISLNKNSSEYEVKRLNEIEVSGKSFWGIPSNSYKTNKNKQGLIVRFNGLELGRTPQLYPILTMAAYTYGVGQIIKSSFGYKEITSGKYTYTSNDPKVGLLPSMLLGLPISGALNNFTWSGAAFSGATNELNYRLVTDNPNVDVFLNPKYTIDYHIGFWSQSANLKAKVMGATIK